MVSDDSLMELLVFKGGSAIDMIYDVSGRSSLDLDFSMEYGLTEEEELEVAQKVERTLVTTFSEHGFHVHDIFFRPKPEKIRQEVKDFWGGYEVNFKIIKKSDAERLKMDQKAIRTQSLPLGKKRSTKFKIDISSYEYIAESGREDFEDFQIRVYTPEMIVFEKLRAICQQLPDYKTIVHTITPKARGRDFYDIELLMTQFNIDPNSESNKSLIKGIFQAKKVPLSFIGRISESKEFHKENFVLSLRPTVDASIEVKPFDHYFDFVTKSFSEMIFRDPLDNIDATS